MMRVIAFLLFLAAAPAMAQTQGLQLEQETTPEPYYASILVVKTLRGGVVQIYVERDFGPWKRYSLTPEELRSIGNYMIQIADEVDPPAAP